MKLPLNILHVTCPGPHSGRRSPAPENEGLSSRRPRAEASPLTAAGERKLQCVFVYVCEHVCMCVYASTHVLVHVYVYTCACVCAHSRASVCVCMCQGPCAAQAGWSRLPLFSIREPGLTHAASRKQERKSRQQRR